MPMVRHHVVRVPQAKTRLSFAARPADRPWDARGCSWRRPEIDFSIDHAPFLTPGTDGTLPSYRVWHRSETCPICMSHILDDATLQTRGGNQCCRGAAMDTVHHIRGIIEEANGQTTIVT
jgi:hypothetical protein